MAENRLSSISKADSDEKIGEFWDTHDFTEFDTDAPDAQFEVMSTVPVQFHLLNEIEEQAAKRGERYLGEPNAESLKGNEPGEEYAYDAVNVPLGG